MFAAAIFLTGLLGIGVPLAIHFLARQRTRVLPWGAMAFLQQSISSASSRRNRLKDLLLLLLRILAILFLVLTFAQPLASRLLVGGSNLETIFIWDVSLSTTATNDTGRPLQELLKESLLEELEKLPDRSQVRILLAGAELRWLNDAPLTLSELNRRALETAIREQQADQAGSEIATAILTAMAVEDDDSKEKRNLLVFHDAQRESWQQEELSRWQSIRQRLAGNRNLSLRIIEHPAEISDRAPQLSVDSLQADRETTAPNTPMRFRVTLKNHSKNAYLKANVIWRIDGREVDRSNDVKVYSGEELQLEQFLSFDDFGCQLVECEAELEEDILPADNIRTAVVSVPDGLPVLIIDDTVRTQKGEILPSEFLSASLGRLVKGDEQTRDSNTKPPSKSLFRPTVLRSEQLDASAIEGNLAVVIASAENLPDSTASALNDFVQNGGGLWIIMDSNWETMPTWAAGLLEELGLASLSETERIVAEDSDHRMKVNPTDPSGAFAQAIAASQLDLHRAEFLAIQKLLNRAYLDDENLLETGEGYPVLLSLVAGAGRVMIQTTDLSRPNTNLPVLQSFVPLMRETMMEAIQGAVPQRNLDPSQPIRLFQSSATNPDDHLRIKSPDGSMREIPNQGNRHEFSETTYPGIYQLEQASSMDLSEIFSVRRPASESVLTQISNEEIAALIESPDTLPAAASDEIRRGRWPLAWIFAILTATFFLSEALLAHHITRRRDTASASIDLNPVF